ncbi:MAG TPA: hypothetical protein VN457_08455, partial [Chlamydiales bacterium]|nr:hypothetical protein [Chlamydiales bacterium]
MAVYVRQGRFSKLDLLLERDEEEDFRRDADPRLVERFCRVFDTARFLVGISSTKFCLFMFLSFYKRRAFRRTDAPSMSTSDLDTLRDQLLAYIKTRAEQFKSPWLLKRSLYRLLTKDKHARTAAGQRVFWTHVKKLVRSQSIPGFTSCDKKGYRVCFRDGKIRKKWCSKCRDGTTLTSCKSCKPVIRFVYKQAEEEKAEEQVEEKVEAHVEENVESPTSFKGLSFTQFILPQVLAGFENADKPTMRCGNAAMLHIIDDACQQRSNDLTVVNQLLERVYGTRPERTFKLWIAPIRSVNATVSLFGLVHLDDTNSVREQACKPGNHHVWGFNEKDVFKWYSLQADDIVIFGNVQEGMIFQAFVSSKFIWKPNCSKAV